MFDADDFDSNLMYAVNNVINVIDSSFSTAANYKLKGLVFYLDESSLIINKTKFRNLSSI
jgi:hypothetical protein